MATLKNRFSRAKIYDIDGWEFPQHLSLLVYERTWLLEQQQKRNDSARGLVTIAQKIATERGLPISEVLDTMSQQGDNAMLLPYLDEIQALSKDRSGEDLRDGVRVLLRSRLSAKWLADARVELNECFELVLSEADVKAFEMRGVDRLFPDIEVEEQAYKIQLCVEKIIDCLPSATFFKMAEFIDMENSGVATPKELPTFEPAEPTKKKTLEPSSNSKQKGSTKNSQALTKPT